MTHGQTELDLEIEPAQEPAIQPAALDRLSHAVGESFPLRTLLQFLPDVALKARLNAKAARLLEIDLAGDGLQQAEALRAEMLSDVDNVLAMFDGSKAAPGPTALAHQLHKRLCDLRADFVAAATSASAVVGPKIVKETRERETAALAEAKAAQDRADEAAREDARLALAEVRGSGGDAAVEAVLEREAATGSAPPVHVPASRPMARSTVAEKWRVRLKGSGLEGDAAQPTDLTRVSGSDVKMLLDLFKLVGEGQVPLSYVLMNWSALNKRAGADKAAFAIPCLEAYDEGSLRRKGGR